jgi:hypothetical protein
LPSLRAVLDWHLRRYPLLQAADTYKLIHQSVFGPGHIITGAEAARTALEQEMARLEPGASALSDELEPIDPAGRLARVNLKPLVGRPETIERLVAVLVESANTIRGTNEDVETRLAAALGWCRERLPFLADELAVLSTEVRAAGFPARHHSTVYLRNYRPAYRVVRLDLWDRPPREV